MSQGKGLGYPALSFIAARLLTGICLVAGCATPLWAQVRPAYQYTLSSFGGPLRDDWVRVQVDTARDEIYVVYQNIVRVFNPSGMQIFSFGENLDVGQIVDVAVDPAGNVLLLSYKDSGSLVTRCNYRGVPIATVRITNLPAGLVFYANRLKYQSGLLYFLSLPSATVVVTDANGQFRKRIDLVPPAQNDENRNGGAEVSGFTVDQEGSIYFSVPVWAKVVKVAPDGKSQSFGSPGSGAGKFGVVAGVAVDSRGNILVADKLKCVVMAFDKDFRFLGEFGYRGARPQNLVMPDDVAIDSKDRIYVSQARRRGVSVFALNPS